MLSVHLLQFHKPGQKDRVHCENAVKRCHLLVTVVGLYCVKVHGIEDLLLVPNDVRDVTNGEHHQMVALDLTDYILVKLDSFQLKLVVVDRPRLVGRRDTHYIDRVPPFLLVLHSLLGLRVLLVSFTLGVAPGVQLEHSEVELGVLLLH